MAIVRPRPALFDPERALTGLRVTSYRVDLLDWNDNKIGVLDGVGSGSSLEWSSFTAIKGSGTLDVTDVRQGVDWIKVRVRPVVLLGDENGNPMEEKPVGVFIPSAPVEDWSATGRSWSVELLDKNAILDQDIPTDEDGNPITYSVGQGTDVLQTVKDLIASSGEPSPAIAYNEEDSKSLENAMTWDMGTTKLQIINDLLAAAGYNPLWCDGAGQYRAEPVTDPRDVPPVYEGLAPFSKSESSLMSPDWTRDRDIYSIPNRYVAISPGDGDEEAMVSVVTNEDAESPFSYQARGRWITMVNSDVEATSQGDLDSRARSGLASATSITSGITVKHMYLPNLVVGVPIRFTAEDFDMLCTVGKTTIPLDPTELCESEVREVVI